MEVKEKMGETFEELSNATMKPMKIWIEKSLGDVPVVQQIRLCTPSAGGAQVLPPAGQLDPLCCN